MRRDRKSRAFVLLSTMLVIMVLGLILRVAIIRMPSVMGAASQTVSQDLAARAAESGLEFAVAMLRADPTWKGGTVGRTLVDQPGLRVVSEQGNVIGVMTGLDGAVSEFRLRFSYQDGPEGADDRPDPSSAMMFDTPFVSVNNLDSDVEKVVPRGTGPNGQVVDPEAGYETPERSVCLIVEGRSLRSDGTVAAKETTEVVYLMSTDRSVTDAVVMAGGGLDIEVRPNTGRVQLAGALLEMASDQLLRLRSKAGIEVTDPSHNARPISLEKKLKAELSHGDEGVVANYPDRVATAKESESSDFYNLPWGAVKQADQGNAVILKAGTYAYGRWGQGVAARKLIYFDMPLQEYLETLPPASAGVVVDETMSAVRTDSRTDITAAQISAKPAMLVAPYYDPNKRKTMYPEYPGFTMKVKDVDVRIQATAKSQGFALVPQEPHPFHESEPNLIPARSDALTPDHMKLNLTKTTISSDDDIVLHGGISGKGGTLTSGGDVKIHAGRTLSMETDAKTAAELEGEIFPTIEDSEDDPGSGGQGPGDPDDPDGNPEPEKKKREVTSLQLNIYSKGQLAVSTFAPKTKKYRNLSFKGLLYSWDDVSILAAGQGKTGRGGFNLKGALVAYGADPETGQPGTLRDDGSKRGKVTIKANNASLRWDPRYLPALSDMESEGAMQFSLQRALVNYPKN
jgi:hypothetical protein